MLKKVWPFNKNLILSWKKIFFLKLLHKAICKENNCESLALDEFPPDDANAARIPVKVVPILLPKVSGKILSKSTNPKPTNGIKLEVKTELDWTSIVNKHPTNKAIYPVKYLPTAPPGKSELIPFF